MTVFTLTWISILVPSKTKTSYKCLFLLSIKQYFKGVFCTLLVSLWTILHYQFQVKPKPAGSYLCHWSHPPGWSLQSGCLECGWWCCGSCARVKSSPRYGTGWWCWCLVVFPSTPCAYSCRGNETIVWPYWRSELANPVTHFGR